MKRIPDIFGVIDDATVLIDASTLEVINLPIVGRVIDTELDLLVGRKYTSEYRPSILYRVDQNGNNMIREKIRINSYFLSIVGYELNMTKTGIGRADRIETFNSLVSFEGEVSFYFKDFTTDAQCNFWTSSHLGCEIDMISYTGQFWEYAGGM